VAQVAKVSAGPVVLVLDETVAAHYGALRAALERRGRAKSDFDLVIAVTAMLAGATLVTHDQALLDHSIDGLRVEDWLSVLR
jgi:tRNA(fMet)-specific endonuclease VapC